ncbi:hypothetical protein [Duganella vulcania]|uniref:Uncharacterized protein n=1 Tax=Duganella vulcania TaxID=2692166 RepID=A0A845GG34_9BURK|nr:hypothetical protein [Duganella vulcania]MYM92470.1 hypothetical protein [Duganella vulcania]
MSLRDVLEVVVKAYEEALLDDRYELPSRNQAGINLLLAPINRYVPPFTRSWPQLDTSITFEQMYDAFLAHMLSELMLARVDWLKKGSSPANPSHAEVEHSAAG